MIKLCKMNKMKKIKIFSKKVLTNENKDDKIQSESNKQTT